jgi:hypothetical protein
VVPPSVTIDVAAILAKMDELEREHKADTDRLEAAINQPGWVKNLFSNQVRADGTRWDRDLARDESRAVISGFETPLAMLDENDAPEAKHGIRFELLAPLVYYSGFLAQTIIVPTGFVTDLASIPRPLYIALPPVGSYDKAAVVHDFLYRHPDGFTYGKPLNRGEADLIIREAMEALRVEQWKRFMIYRGVRLGGWVPWRAYRKAKPSAVSV